MFEGAVVAGAVLAGGRSRRLGRDKALVEVDGRPMGAHVVGVLTAAGALDVVVVGGTADHAARLGAPVVDDRWPGAGPLGGIVTALEHHRGTGRHADLVVVAACDLPDLDVATVQEIVAGLARRPAALAAVPLVDGHRQVTAAAWRPSAVHRLAALFRDGERSPRRAVEQLDVADVDVTRAEALVDVDTPDDLRAARRR